MGYHLYHFYESDLKLAKVLARFFAEGLRKLEFCIWVPRAGITYNKAVKLLKKHIPDIEDFLLTDQMYIEPFDTWGLKEDGTFDKYTLLEKWDKKYNEVIEKGYMMMRAAGDPSSVAGDNWDDLMEFESVMDDKVNDANIAAVCTYPGKVYKPTEIQAILKNHFCPLTPSP